MEGNHFDNLHFLQAPSYSSQVQDSNADMRFKLSKLTIFYEDDVYVYPDISPEMAKCIMAMAENESLINGTTEPATKASKAVRDMATNHYLQAQPSNALAQARKASLQRFLHRRKCRLEAFGIFPSQ